MYPNPEIFGIEIAWYHGFHRLALICSIVFGLYYYKKYSEIEVARWKIAYVIIVLILIGFVGARIFYSLEYFLDLNEWPEKFTLYSPMSQGNLRWYGTVFLFIAVLPFLLLPVLGKKATFSAFDLLGISFCLFIVVAKQACQFSGDGCYGVPTTLPWGMYYLHGPAPNLLPAHPTPIYDSLFHLILLITLFKLSKKELKVGVIGVLFFLGTSFFNFFLEFIRRNENVVFGLTFAQLTYLTIFFLAIFYYFYFIKKFVDKSSTNFQNRNLVNSLLII